MLKNESKPDVVERIETPSEPQGADPRPEPSSLHSDVIASASVTPSLVTGGTVPRRRFQRGRLIQRGKTPMWVGMFREDRLQPTFKRIRRTMTLGPVSAMSRRHALAALQPFLDAVNTAAAPIAMKRGKSFAETVKEWQEQIAVNLKPSTVRAELMERAMGIELHPQIKSLVL